MVIMEVSARLEARIDRDSSPPCWLWTGGKNQYGYGRFYVAAGQPQAVAHRAVYELHRGPVPAGLVLDHLCRVPACVNPDHLEPVSHAENLRRGATKGGALYTPPTHCPHGHEYDESNTYWRRGAAGNMTRDCRACRNRSRPRPAAPKGNYRQVSNSDGETL